uniref:NADH-ubiquinone oxidoreductase chain 6 n=1 Tax=Mystonectes coelamboides TaxID=2811597 RepID=A0A894JSZ8_9DYTI|nr:NADH dehydrogenase subunit 6 [Mystonectes coelamboides]QRV62774.1 NADH dehydrogenase subunit 6 [Mystonectes coelamboides]
MMMICMIMNLSMTFIFMFLNHPMSMGLILMIQTICIALITGFFSHSLWFSYMLFLIMVGGMLILLMYMTSLASNEKFKLSKKLFMFMLIFSSMMMILFLMNNNMFYMLIKNTNIMEMINNINLLKNDNINSLTMMYNYPNFMITILMINYLFLTLIAVVKITQSNQGPLRQKF